MRRNSVTPLASPEPTKKPRINSFEEHVASASAVPSCLPPEVPAQLPGQVRQPRLPRLGPRVPRPGGEGGPAGGCGCGLRPRPACGWVLEGRDVGAAPEGGDSPGVHVRASLPVAVSVHELCEGATSTS